MMILFTKKRRFKNQNRISTSIRHGQWDWSLNTPELFESHQFKTLLISIYVDLRNFHAQFTNPELSNLASLTRLAQQNPPF